MKLLGGSKGITATVPKMTIREYGSRKAEQVTGFLSTERSSSKWVVLTKKHIILIKAKSFKLMAGKGETEWEAEHGDNVRCVGSYGGLEQPTTKEVIEFFNFKVEEEQILEFSD